MDKLPIDGDLSVRKEPFPIRRPFGNGEEVLLLKAVRSQNLFGKNGVFVKAFKKTFAKFYGVTYA